MDEACVVITRDGDVATVRLERGKVNALTPEMLHEIGGAVRSSVNTGARAIVLTGTGSFFSFGFDVPHMIDWPRARFGEFLHEFCSLYHEIFLAPVPVVAALNGHAVAGGCILALTADHRVMTSGKARMSLNEVTFGASIFAGVVEMLRFHVDGRTASRVLLRGEMLTAEEALAMGLVDTIEEPDRVLPVAQEFAAQLCSNLPAYAGMKSMLRRAAGERMAALEPGSIEDFLDIWYSPETQSQLTNIQIR